MQSQQILKEAQSIQEWIISIRRELHRFPELMYEEVKTSQRVRETLTELDIPFCAPVAETGVVATVGDGNGPCIALRADMDALPLEEKTGPPPMLEERLQQNASAGFFF